MKFAYKLKTMMKTEKNVLHGIQCIYFYFLLRYNLIMILKIHPMPSNFPSILETHTSIVGQSCVMVCNTKQPSDSS